jgi:hypothetical protein
LLLRIEAKRVLGEAVSSNVVVSAAATFFVGIDVLTAMIELSFRDQDIKGEEEVDKEKEDRKQCRRRTGAVVMVMPPIEERQEKSLKE